MDQLRQYLNNDSCETDSAMEELLLDESLSEEVNTLLQELWDREVVAIPTIDKDTILNSIKSNTSGATKATKTVAIRRPLILKRVIGSVAAALLIGVLLTVFFYDSPQEQPKVATVIQTPQPQVEEVPEPTVTKEPKSSPKKIEAHEVVIHVPEGETLALDFKCGSKALIQGGSNVVYDENFVGDKRLVKLDGRAHFKIAKAEKTFEVSNDNVSIEVLGTEFYIDNRTSKDVISVRVDKGHVVVTTIKGTKIDLYEGDDIVFVSRKPEEQ